MTTDSNNCVPLLKALADDSRWQIVRALLNEPSSVGKLGERLGMSQYNVSKHLRILREAGIVATRRSGKQVHCEVAEAVRKKLKANKRQLDLGCCSFTFE